MLVKTSKLLFSLVFFFNSIFLFSQDQTDAQKEINALFQKVNLNRRSTDSIKKFATQILKISENNKLPVSQIRALSLLGVTENRKRNFQKSIVFFYKGKSLAKKHKQIKAFYGLLNNIALNHMHTSYADSATYYFKKLEKHYVLEKDFIAANMARMNMGANYYLANHLDSSLYYFKKSVQGFKAQKNTTSRMPIKNFIASNFNRISDIYILKKDYQKTVAYADSSLRIAKEINFKPTIPQSYNLLARAYKHLGNKELSDQFYALEKTAKNGARINPNNAMTIISGNTRSRVAKNNDLNDRLNEKDQKKEFLKSGLFIVLLVLFIVLIFGFIILKNYRTNRKELDKLQEELEEFNNQHTIQKPTDNFIHLKSKAVINTNEILYLKSDGHYVEIYMRNKNNPEIERSSLTEILTLLPPKDFIRIHRSFIVNIHTIKIINATQLMLENGIWIKLSRTYKQQLKEILNKK